VQQPSGQLLGAVQVEGKVDPKRGDHRGDDRTEPASHEEPPSPPRPRRRKGDRRLGAEASRYRRPQPKPRRRRGYPSRVRIYTKAGDDGTTGLLYGGRISKADPLTDAYGSVDEAVAALGLARAFCPDHQMSELILRLQRELFVVGADLATN